MKLYDQIKSHFLLPDAYKDWTDRWMASPQDGKYAVPFSWQFHRYLLMLFWKKTDSHSPCPCFLWLHLVFWRTQPVTGYVFLYLSCFYSKSEAEKLRRWSSESAFHMICRRRGKNSIVFPDTSIPGEAFSNCLKEENDFFIPRFHDALLSSAKTAVFVICSIWDMENASNSSGVKDGSWIYVWRESQNCR